MSNPKRGKKRKVRNTETILCDPAYWRIQADIYAIKDFLGTAFMEAIRNQVAQNYNPSKKEVLEWKADFEKRFAKLAAKHHSDLLSELERLSPELAAAMDNREISEVDTH